MPELGPVRRAGRLLRAARLQNRHFLPASRPAAGSVELDTEPQSVDPESELCAPLRPGHPVRVNNTDHQTGSPDRVSRAAAALRAAVHCRAAAAADQWAGRAWLTGQTNTRGQPGPALTLATQPGITVTSILNIDRGETLV